MNIFYLSSDPVKSAQYHCDSHVVKMPVESVQMLITARVMNGDISVEQVKEHADQMSIMYSHPSLDLDGPTYNDVFKTHYTPRMRNHPCSIWVRECFSGFGYLQDLLACLGDEYTKRYGKTHKSVLFYESLPTARIRFRRRKKMPVPLAVGNHNKYEGQPVRTYREFYKSDKSSFAKWSYSEQPYWW
jgi:hypothetical protein